jgi:hypothetical protein
MELTFVTDLGQSFVVEIDPNMELENVMALLEAEVRHTASKLTNNLSNSLTVGRSHTRAEHISQWSRTKQSESDYEGVRCRRERDAYVAAESQCWRQASLIAILTHYFPFIFLGKDDGT